MGTILPAFAAALVATALAATAARAQHGDIQVAASGGALAATGDFDESIRLQPSFCAAGLCLYSTTDPGFVSADDASAPLSTVAAGTALRVELVAVDPGAALKVGTTVLDSAGEWASIGTAPSVHLHPSWQVTGPPGAMIARSLSFRFTATSGYAPSSPVQVTLRTFDPVETTTTTVASTTTLGPEAWCGDGVVDAAAGEQCDSGLAEPARGTPCTASCSWAACGDVDHSGAWTASDALHALRTAVGTATCDACVCDTRDSGAVVFSAADALVLLRKAVGGAVALECPACGEPGP